MRPLPILILAALLLGLAPASAGQDASMLRVELVDGTVIVGRVADPDADPLVIVQADGATFEISRARIAGTETLARGRYARTDPSTSRLFFAPTARTMGRGNGRLGAYFIFPTAAYAPADGLDLHATGTIPIIIGRTCEDEDGVECDDGPFGLVGFSAKGQVYRAERAAVAVGASLVTPYGFDSDGLGGSVFAVVTLGTETSALTVGATGFFAGRGDGLGLAGDLRLERAAMLTLGLERQLSGSSKLISETHLLAATGGTGGSSVTGFRFFGDHLSADVALVAAFGNGGGLEVAPIPYLAFSYAF